MDHLSLIRAWDQRAKQALMRRQPGSIRALLGNIPPGASAELIAALNALLPEAEAEEIEETQDTLQAVVRSIRPENPPQPPPEVSEELKASIHRLLGPPAVPTGLAALTLLRKRKP